MMRILRAGLAPCLVAGLASLATAQVNTPPYDTIPFPIDTGYVSNTGNSEAVVLSFFVNQPNAAWMRLFFEQVEMAPTSTLKITSSKDGYFQTMNLQHVHEWNQSSAYFNGDDVLVELIARPFSGPHRLVLKEIHAGLPARQSGEDTICGPTDDRTRVIDNRTCRLLSIGCTGWIIDDCARCMITAGHCVGGSSVAQFNVPSSTGSGTLVNPPPEDQYSLDTASKQSQNSGQDNDWAYFGVFRNPNTGMTPFEAYGGAFSLVTAPAQPDGNAVRITGFGTDSGVDNQTCQTHAGPMTNTTGTRVAYRADTTGGNSGSPCIWLQDGRAVGVHGYGGCTSGGGENSGTDVDHPNFLAARANPLGVCAQPTGGFLNLSYGLAGSNGIPSLSGTSSLMGGAGLQMDLVSTVPNSKAFFITGFSRLNGSLLGGTLVPAFDVMSVVSTDGAGEFHANTTWPAGFNPCTYIYIQAWILDMGAPQGMSASNAVLGITP